MNEYLVTDKFIDFEGVEHSFTLAAVKESIKLGDFVGLDKEKKTNYGSVLKIGVSICNPADKFVEGIGVTKALGRAYKSSPVIFASCSGQLTDELIRFFIKQEANYLKNNPGKYIKGYSDAARKYTLNKSMEKLHESFSDFDKIVAENLKKDPTYLEDIQKYVNFWRKTNK